MASVTAEADLDRLLALALDARFAETGPIWKRDVEEAIDRYAECCDAVWAELNRLIDARGLAGNPVQPLKPPPDPAKALRKRIAAKLRNELPGMVTALIEEEVAHADF